MPLLPPETIRPEDRPLHENVRWLADTLGKAIRRLEGEECFQAVEHLRASCRARRLDAPGAPGAPGLAELLSFADALPLPTAARVARAFTLFFLLINTAEQVHRVRRRREREGSPGEPPQPASVRWALERLRDQGRGADDVSKALAGLEIRPVLTAHPTQATRRAVLALQARVAEKLLARDLAPPLERRALEEALTAEVELLWLTAEARQDRPTVRDEVGDALWYLENRFLEAGARLSAEVRRAYSEVFGAELMVLPKLRVGSWVGGDRDGNPFVTPEVTLEAVRRASSAVLGAYRNAVERLFGRLTLSTRIKAAPPALGESLERDREELPGVWEESLGRDEPVRLKLRLICARLEANRDAVSGAGASRGGAAYPNAAAFERDLLVVAEALEAAGADHSRRIHLDPLLDWVRVHGFFGYLLDVRDDSRVHAEAVEDIARAVELSAPDRSFLERELLGRRPLLSDLLPVGERTRQVVEVFRVLRRVQEEVAGAASTYIVSMTHAPEDLLRVLLLAREAGLADLAADPPRSGLDVVPLFETREDLLRAPEVMGSLLQSPAYRRQLRARGMRQEIMIGYSDSAKDAGLIPASWALYLAQERLARVCRGAGVSPAFFHGRGGSVGRGGGAPVFRALTALPPGTVEGRIKVTEQGEVVSQKFGQLPLAARSLEVMLSGTLVASLQERSELEPGEETRFREVMDRLAEEALVVYRRLVHEDDRLFRLLLRATPVEELAHVHFGSRPAYREAGAGTVQGIRAIPWVFGWTQIRLNLPAWLGAGTALSRVAGEPGGRAVLRRMARTWPFFDDLLGKIEMICAKTDPEIARAYVSRLSPGDLDLMDELEGEFSRTVEAVRGIRQTPYFLMGQPLLQTDIAHRDPYLDPLSVLQVSLLDRKRRCGPEDPSRALLDQALGSTLNGLAQGLRNTG
jgi:phosphoenolpyruvate carboxylase